MSVLILGDPEDPHVAQVRRQLQQRRGSVLVVDARRFPQQMSVAFDPIAGSGYFESDGARMEFGSIKSVYWRTYDSVITPELPDPEQSFLAHNDARSLFESLLIWLPARWVNGWEAWQLHQTKPVQLARIARLGVPTPATLLTNDPEAVGNFVRRIRQIIAKPVQGGAHAFRLTDEMLSPPALQRLSMAPITLQEEIAGTNIRAFVAGERVLACEIRTNAVDFRDDPQPQITVHPLSTIQAEHCRQIARSLALQWTGIDFRLTPDGEYVFLEANPSPMFLGFEAATRLPLTEALLDLLC